MKTESDRKEIEKYVWLCEYCHCGEITDNLTPPTPGTCKSNKKVIKDGTSQVVTLGPHFWKLWP
jgi:hypothetical protein